MSSEVPTDKKQAGDEIEESFEEEEDDAQVAHNVPNSLMEFSNVLHALQAQRNTEIVAHLPPVVKRRVKALKKKQLEITNIEAKFYVEVHKLECKYHKLYQPLYDTRKAIISGQYEPTEEECQWPSDSEDDDEEETKDEKVDDLTKKFDEKTKLTKSENHEPEEKKDAVPCLNADIKGVPDFWLTVFRNVALMSEMVQTHDEPILKHLVDITNQLRDDPMGFTLEFHFSPNEYFTNSVLTKSYEMKCVPDEDDPFGFEGPEIYKCVGCTINWNKGKNVTVKTVKKKQKHKSRGVVRTVTKTVQNDSFFNFFTPPVIPDSAKGDDIDEDLRSLITSDFEIGHYIRERLIPKATLFFTGDCCDDEQFDEDDEELDEDDEEEEEDDENDVVPAVRAGKRSSRTNQNQTNGDGVTDPNAQNCKQQ